MSVTLKNRPIFADLPTPIGYIKAVIFSWACARARCEFGPESANLRRFGVNGDNRSPRTPRICARSCTCLGRIPRHAARRAGLSPFSMHGRSEAEEPVIYPKMQRSSFVRTTGQHGSSIRHPRPLFRTIRASAEISSRPRAKFPFGTTPSLSEYSAPLEEGLGVPSSGLTENAFFRYKSIIGDSLRARSPAGQGSEVVLGCDLLNRMTDLGRPASYSIGR